MSDFEYPPGTFGAERIRLQRELDEAVAALPFWLRWTIGRKARREAAAVDALMVSIQAAEHERMIAEILSWRDDD